MKTVSVHVERIVIEPQPGVPAATGPIIAALQSAITRELVDCSREIIPEAIERAVRAAFMPPQRRRP
jgi:hypothetical protein